MTILAAQSVSHFFHEAVEDSMRVQKIDATDGATRYLVALLADYVHPEGRTEETLERPLTLLFDEALRAPDPGERFQRLRVIGDGILYGCGFFGDHFEARGVDTKYLFGMGARAYGTAGAMLRRPAGTTAGADGPDVFGELSEKFGRFVDVLADIADTTVATGVETSRGLLKVYERWLKTGSGRLATALTSVGVVPTRGTRGVLQ
jgi:hypothetical protein